MKYLVVLGLSFLLAAPVSAAQFEKNLKFGARGEEVKKMQEFLADHDFYTGPITGNFYSLTLKGLKKFQVAHGLPSTGFFGGMTRTEANVVIESELSGQDSEPDFSSTPEVASSTSDFLDFQTKVLKAQLEEQQKQTQLLQQQIQSQASSSQQIQQTLNQVVNNTTIVQTPATPIPVVSIVSPVVTPVEVVAPNELRVWQSDSSMVLSDPPIKAVYFSVILMKDGSNYKAFKDLPISITAPDQNSTITYKMDGMSQEAFGFGYFISFVYTPKTKGIQTITFTSGNLEKSVTVEVK